MLTKPVRRARLIMLLAVQYGFLCSFAFAQSGQEVERAKQRYEKLLQEAEQKKAMFIQQAETTYALDVAAAKAEITKVFDEPIKSAIRDNDSKKARALTLQLDAIVGDTTGNQAFENALPVSNVELLAKNAKLTGAVNHIPQSESVGFWYNTTDTITFTVPNLAEGEYVISIVYGAAPVTGGGVLSLRLNDAELKKIIRPTKAWQDFSVAQIGVLKHQGGPATIVLQAAKINKEALMDIQSVSLHRK